MIYFIDHYNKKREEFLTLSDKKQKELKKKENYSKLKEFLKDDIKWSRELASTNLTGNKKITFDEKKIIKTLYRPFIKKYLYYDTESYIITVKGQTQHIFGVNGSLDNVCIIIPGIGSRKEWGVFASNVIADLNIKDGGIFLFPRYRYLPHTLLDLQKGKVEKIDNISDSSLLYFQLNYNDSKITKDDIFYYVYSVLNKKEYSKTYKNDLFRSLPKIPLLKDFTFLSKIGKKLIDLCINYESIKPYDLEYETFNKKGAIKYSLSYNKDKNTINISNDKKIINVPKECKEYTLGGRTAIDWVLEFYKESKNQVKDEGIKKLKQDYYSLDDKKIMNELLDTLSKVISVSIEHEKLLDKLEKIRFDVKELKK